MAVFLDSTGLGVLIGLLHRLRTVMGCSRWSVTRAIPRIPKVFHITRLTQVVCMSDTVTDASEPGYRTDLIGSWDEGLFFAGYWGMTYLHEFDHDGNHVRSRIAIAEQQLGTTDVTSCMTRLRDVVAALPGRRFGDIAVRLFSVEHDGRRWGLFDETADYVIPHVEMRPDRLGFAPPWDGLYDT